MNNKKHNVEIQNGKSKDAVISDVPEIGPHEDVIKEDKVSKLENENSSLREALLRKAAEFSNYKKRADSEISNYIKYASENIIKELIPVYDDLGRSIDSINKGETKDLETLRKGITQIYEKFKNVLEKEGLKEINSLGKEFNVDVNSALMQIPRDDVKPNTVLDVVEKGYRLKDKVIKHEKVLVSSKSN